MTITPTASVPKLHEWGLDPTFWSHIKIFVRDVHRLTEADSLDDSHMFGDRPVHTAQFVGIVVAIQLKPGRFDKYLLDDGTGLLVCTSWVTDSSGVRRAAGPPLRLGDCAMALGRLGRFRGQSELIVSLLRAAAPDEEQLHWIEAVELGRALYAHPFRRAAYVDNARLLGARRPAPARCTCGALYSAELAYCHCIAGVLPADPVFAFRDAVVAFLLAAEVAEPDQRPLHVPFQRLLADGGLRRVAEEVLTTRIDGSSQGSGSNGGSRSGGGGSSRGDASSSGRSDNVSGACGVGQKRPFCDASADDRTDSVGSRSGGSDGSTSYVNGIARTGSGSSSGGGGNATRSAASDSSAGAAAKPHWPPPSASDKRAHQLFRQAVQRLRQDGLLFLADPHRDVYLFVSRRRVLQPAVERLRQERGLGLEWENRFVTALQTSGPPELRVVPGPRVKVCLRLMRGEPSGG